MSFRRSDGSKRVTLSAAVIIGVLGITTLVDWYFRRTAPIQMAGGVAHEINNPLAIIHASATDLLRQTKEEGGVSPAIAVRNGQPILDTANRVMRIIKSLRQLSREGRQDWMRPVSAAKIVEDTLEVCWERFKHHSIQLFVPDVDLGLTVLCREVQIGQVLLNLLRNAQVEHAIRHEKEVEV